MVIKAPNDNPRDDDLECQQAKCIRLLIEAR